MADAGADILVVGFTSADGRDYLQQRAQVPSDKGTETEFFPHGKTALTLEESAKRVQAIHDAAKGVNPEILVYHLKFL